MAYLVLARKYRPQTFADLVGQEHISRTLTNAIKLGRVAHAFLFTGVRGVGKTSAARILAKALNCTKGPTSEPCNECVACKEITSGISADVLEIDGASNRGIDSIRELRESVRYMPRQGSFRIFIIDEVHMLTQESFNALLKTLEEPPAHVKFIFATTEAHKIPITILSRCQRYDFHRISTPELTSRIEKILADEKINIAKAGISKISRAAEGSMRDALSLLDQVISFGGDNVSAEMVAEALGSADRGLLFRAAKAVFTRDPKSVLLMIEDAFRKGHDMGQLAEDLLTLFRDLVAAKAGASVDELTDEDKAEVKSMIGGIALPEIVRAFQLLSKTCEEIARSANPKVLVEVTLVKLATLPPLLPWDELLGRLEKLEARLESGGGPSGVAPPSRGTPSRSGSEGPFRASAEDSAPFRVEPPEPPPLPALHARSEPEPFSAPPAWGGQGGEQRAEPRSERSFPGATRDEFSPERAEAKATPRPRESFHRSAAVDPQGLSSEPAERSVRSREANGSAAPRAENGAAKLTNPIAKAPYRSKNEDASLPEYLREEVPLEEPTLPERPRRAQEAQRPAPREPQREPERPNTQNLPKDSGLPPIEPLAWERAVRSFKEKRPLIGSYYERGAFIKATAHQVTIAFPPGSLEGDSARDPEKKKTLEGFLAESFGRAIFVDIIERAGAEQETIFAKGEIKAAEDRRKRERATAEHPTVKEVLRIFGIDETAVTTKLKDP